MKISPKSSKADLNRQKKELADVEVYQLILIHSEEKEKKNEEKLM